MKTWKVNIFFIFSKGEAIKVEKRYLIVFSI